MSAGEEPARDRSFFFLVGAQFFGAFNDNLYKQLLLLLAAKWMFPGEDQQGIAFAVFAAPFLLFSGFAGDLSERLSKRAVIVAMKFAEVAIMVLGAIALQCMNWMFLLAVLFLMGAQSAIFGPSKYGVIPEIVPERGLLRANGTIAMTTFLSILLGQALAGPLLDAFGDLGATRGPGRLWITGATCAAFAVAGWTLSLGMRRLEPTRPDLRLPRQPFGNLFSTMRAMARERHLLTAVLVNSVFWFDGGVLQQAVNGLGGDSWLAIGPGENKLLSWLLVTLAGSVMAGCMLAPRVARAVRPSRMIACGCAAMAAAQALLILVGPVLSREQGGYALAHAALALAGLSGAMFVVPVTTYLQAAPEPGSKGQAFAVNNFCNFSCIFLAGGFYQAGSMMALAPAVTAALAGLVLLAALFLGRAFLHSCDERHRA
ncbi:MAG: hypothetical protein Fur0037_20390 [Planctomycetota bacterium]